MVNQRPPQLAARRMARAFALKRTDKIVYEINDYVKKSEEPYFHTTLALEKQVNAIIDRYENKEANANIETKICAVKFGEQVWSSSSIIDMIEILTSA